METAIDKFILAIPDNVYDLCPCGCGKKWKFAMKEDINLHIDKFIEDNTCDSVG